MNQTAESLWFVFYKDELLLEKEGNGTFAIPCGEIPPILIKDKTTVHNITTLEGRNCKAYSVSQPIEKTQQYAMIGLRASYEYLPLGHYQAAGKAHEILHWDRNSLFCSACGTPMEQKESIMKRCPSCGREVYPAISTAVLVLVRKGEIKLQEEELSSGDFYTRDNLPELPRKLSLARKMIDWWLECSHK